MSVAFDGVGATRDMVNAICMTPNEARALLSVNTKERHMPNVEKMLQNEWLDIDEEVEASDHRPEKRDVWLVLNVADESATDVVGAYDAYDKAKARLSQLVLSLRDVLYHSNVQEHPYKADVYNYYVAKGTRRQIKIVKKEVM